MRKMVQALFLVAVSVITLAGFQSAAAVIQAQAGLCPSELPYTCYCCTGCEAAACVKDDDDCDDLCD